MTTERLALTNLADFDLAVVIPSCGEGREIVGAVSAAERAISKLSEDIRVVVIVVLNNPPNHDDYRTSNELSRDILSLYAEKEPQGDYVQIHHKNENFEAMKAAPERLNLVMIDMFSDGHVQQGCNVGMARRVGENFALTLLKDNGIMFCSDADSVAGENCLVEVVDFFKRNTNVAATSCWPEDIEPHEDDLEGQRINNLQRIKDLFHSISGGLQIRFWDKKFLGPRTFALCGCNTAIRKSAYTAIGGRRAMDRGEDSDLSIRLAQAGYKVVENPGQKVYTSLRLDGRTPGDHCYASGCRKLATENPLEYTVESLEYSYFRTLILEYCNDCYGKNAARYASDPEFSGSERFAGYWRNGLRRRLEGKPIELDLSDDELEEIRKAWAQHPDLNSTNLNPALTKTIERVVGNKYPKKSLAEMLVYLWESLEVNVAQKLPDRSLFDAMKSRGLAIVEQLGNADVHQSLEKELMLMCVLRWMEDLIISLEKIKELGSEYSDLYERLRLLLNAHMAFAIDRDNHFAEHNIQGLLTELEALPHEAFDPLRDLLGLIVNFQEGEPSPSPQADL
jgi:GT2 family glycosyltransferase